MVSIKSHTLSLFLRKMGGGIKQSDKIELLNGSSWSDSEEMSRRDCLNASEGEDVPEDKPKWDSLYDTEDL